MPGQWSSHIWACPVIMKTDPAHVAWTCARCGALAITPVGDAPPRQTDSRAQDAQDVCH